MEAPTPNGSRPLTKIEEYEAKRAKQQAAFEAQMARADRSWEKLEAMRAELHPPQCETCLDMGYIGIATGDDYHPTRAVPCPDCSGNTAQAKPTVLPELNYEAIPMTWIPEDDEA
jgi:hypothetical protein